MANSVASSVLFLVLLLAFCHKSFEKLLLEDINDALQTLSKKIDRQVVVLKDQHDNSRKVVDLSSHMKEMEKQLKTEFSHFSSRINNVKNEIEGKIINLQSDIEESYQKTNNDAKVVMLSKDVANVNISITHISQSLDNLNNRLLKMNEELEQSSSLLRDTVTKLASVEEWINDKVSEFDKRPVSYSLQEDINSTSVAIRNGYTCFLASPGVNHCVKYFSDLKAWEDANTSCSRDGGSLVVVINEKDNLKIQEVVAQYGQFQYPWIGLKQISRWGYQWVNGDILEMNSNTHAAITNVYTNFAYFEEWDNDEHRGLDDHECIDMHGSTGKWNDWDCNSRLPYICEYYL